MMESKLCLTDFASDGDSGTVRLWETEVMKQEYRRLRWGTVRLQGKPRSQLVQLQLGHMQTGLETDDGDVEGVRGGEIDQIWMIYVVVGWSLLQRSTSAR